jgi:hypothetical protein
VKHAVLTIIVQTLDSIRGFERRVKQPGNRKEIVWIENI